MEMPYSAGLDAIGGGSPETWTLVDGALPAGLALDPATGRISGTAPVLKPAKTALSTFTVELSDSMGAADFATFTMAVVPSHGDSCNALTTAPASLTELDVWPMGSDLYLGWNDAGDATGYDVVGGRMSTLRAVSGDFAGSTDACLASDHTATGLTVAGTPAAGEVFWFLVRPMNCAGGRDLGFRVRFPEPAPRCNSGLIAQHVSVGIRCIWHGPPETADRARVPPLFSGMILALAGLSSRNFDEGQWSRMACLNGATPSPTPLQAWPCKSRCFALRR